MLCYLLSLYRTLPNRNNNNLLFMNLLIHIVFLSPGCSPFKYILRRC